MQVQHVKTLIQGQNTIARPQAMAWSANNKRLAVADANRVINLFDEMGERRDKFPTKAADGKGGKNYTITGLAFSPDSAKIAVAQFDNIVFVYRIGLEWGDKKSICNKFPQTNAVTCVAWPDTSNQGMELVAFGTQEGKVKVGVLKANKSQTLYTHEHPVLSITTSVDHTKLLCGHMDGSIFMYTFDASADSDGLMNGMGNAPIMGGNTNINTDVAGARRVCVHPCPPCVLAWGEHIIAGGCDCVLTFYNPKNGQKVQSFDYPNRIDGEFTCGACNPSGQAIVVGARDKLRVFDFNLRARKWEEGKVIDFPHSYAFPVLTWKHDGSRFVVGTLTGSVEMFDACIRRYRIHGAFEFTYVCHNQVIVKRLANGTRIVLRSNMGYEIQRVNVYKDRYLVAYTSATLLVGDLVSCKLSEVPWQLSGKEKFVFDNAQVCMVFNAGELCLIEYSNNALLGTCRTEEHSAHRISVRIYDEGANLSNTEVSTPNGTSQAISSVVNSNNSNNNSELTRTRKFIAYLIDRLTIQVDDLVSGVSVARIAHNYKIDWLELNYRADKLLYRDKQHQLMLYNLITQQRTTLLNYCTYVEWVPNSDVVVAQNRLELCVWYSIDRPDKVNTIAIKGEVEGMERGNGKTEVVVDEGVNTVAYALDEALIEFGTAMEEHDLNRACELLDKIPLTNETEAMWRTLAEVALREMKLHIATRCFAALNDIASVNALEHIHQLAHKASEESHHVSDGYDHYTVQAELLILNKEFKRAEQLYLENGQVEAAMNMWEEMNKSEEAIAIAELKNLPDLPRRRSEYYNWLMESKQFDKAGAMKEKEGRYYDAINLYLRGGTPACAANVVATYQLKPEEQLLEAIAAALFRSQVFDKAGEFFEKLKMMDRAIDTYKRGHNFSKAVECAKRAESSYSSSSEQELVAQLEEEWGDYLVSQKHIDQAINHYTEAHKIDKGVKAAIDSRQWSKAANILDAQEASNANDTESTNKTVYSNYYKQIARHYEEVRQFSEAEKYYVKAHAINDAVEMYSRANMSDHMYRVAQRHLNQQQLVALFMNQAKQLESKGDYSAAERIYLKVNEPDQAIVMYKKTRDFTNMVRLVQAYRPDYLLKTHLSLASQFEKESNYKMAETHYVAGKDWGKAVNMYRDRDMWEDAVRVAKVHGGSNAAKEVVLSRALVLNVEDGCHLLTKFNLVEAGVDAALDGGKFDLALQWSQMGLPGKLPYVYLKYAMHYEDQGDFRMAEDAFLKSGKPREAIDMYVHQQDFESAMRVAESYDPSAIANICVAHGKVQFQRGNYKDAELLFIKANTPETLVKMYMEINMFAEAQKLAKDKCPELVPEVAKRVALQSNNPQEAGNVLEENGEYELAIDTYLNANSSNVSDATVLANMYVRAVRVAQRHLRKSLKEVLKTATNKLKESGKYIEAGQCFEECEDYKSAINVYVQGKKFDMAETLAKRISPELEEYVRRAIVQDSIAGGTLKDAHVVEEMDAEAAIKAYITHEDFTNALRVASQPSQPAEQYSYVVGLALQHYVKQNDITSSLELIAKHPLDANDFRFFGTWMDFAQGVIPQLPSKTLNLINLHAMLVKVHEAMISSGQSEEDVQRCNALMHIIHIYHTSSQMQRVYNLKEFALKLMLGLPRWIPFIAPDKAFFDAGVAAKNYSNVNNKYEGTAFVYLNHALDITERIDDGDNDSSNVKSNDFAKSDFPVLYQLPRAQTVNKEEMEKINDWVLTVSIETSGANGDNAPTRSLPMIKDPQSGELFFEGALRSPNGNTFPECAITGYPIVGHSGLARCSHCKRPASQVDWNKYIMAAKMCPWCGESETPNFQL